jgi:hypothetical protein
VSFSVAFAATTETYRNVGVIQQCAGRSDVSVLREREITVKAILLDKSVNGLVFLTDVDNSPPRIVGLGSKRARSEAEIEIYGRPAKQTPGIEPKAVPALIEKISEIAGIQELVILASFSKLSEYLSNRDWRIFRADLQNCSVSFLDYTSAQLPLDEVHLVKTFLAWKMSERGATTRFSQQGEAYPVDPSQVEEIRSRIEALWTQRIPAVSSLKPGSTLRVLLSWRPDYSIDCDLHYRRGGEVVDFRNQKTSLGTFARIPFGEEITINSFQAGDEILVEHVNGRNPAPTLRIFGSNSDRPLFEKTFNELCYVAHYRGRQFMASPLKLGLVLGCDLNEE